MTRTRVKTSATAWRKGMWLLTATLACSLSTHAASVERLRSAADVAVIARPAEWVVQSNGVVQLRLIVEDSVLGSQVEPHSVLIASANLRGSAAPRTIRDESPRGLWFLKRGAAGWEVVSAIAGEQHGLKDLYYPIQETDLAAASSRTSSEEVTLAAARGVRASGRHPYLLREVLGTVDSPSVREFLRELVETEDADTRLVGVSQLLMRGDVEALRSLTAREAMGDGRTATLAHLVPQTLSGFFRNTDPEAAALLGQIATDRRFSKELRQASALALSSIHTRESLPYLASLLDDPDPALYAQGATGISFFVNGIGIPDPRGGPSMHHFNLGGGSEYRTAETAQYIGFDQTRASEFIAFWKAWWLEHQFDFL